MRLGWPKRILDEELPGGRARGKPRRRFIVSVRGNVLSKGYNWNEGP